MGEQYRWETPSAARYPATSAASSKLNPACSWTRYVAARRPESGGGAVTIGGRLQRARGQTGASGMRLTSPVSPARCPPGPASNQLFRYVRTGLSGRGPAARPLAGGQLTPAET